MTRNDFDDEEEDGVLDSWEAGDSDEEEKPAAPKAPTKKKMSIQQKIAEREKKEREERERQAVATKAAEDAESKKQREQKAQVDSDLNNAAALFGEVNLHPKARASAAPAEAPAQEAAGPAKLSDLAIFKPTNKQEFDNLRKTLAPLLSELSEKSSLQYGNFVVELARDLAKALTRDQIAKVNSTLNAVASEKQREERANRGKKKKPVAKAASLKVDDNKDTTNYEEFDDDVDFM